MTTVRTPTARPIDPVLISLLMVPPAHRTPMFSGNVNFKVLERDGWTKTRILSVQYLFQFTHLTIEHAGRWLGRANFRDMFTFSIMLQICRVPGPDRIIITTLSSQAVFSFFFTSAWLGYFFPFCYFFSFSIMTKLKNGLEWANETNRNKQKLGFAKTTSYT